VDLERVFFLDDEDGVAAVLADLDSRSQPEPVPAPPCLASRESTAPPPGGLWDIR
jgi:hypothetical protein